MVRRLITSKLVNIEEKLRALPKYLALGDFFTGAGTFVLVVKAAHEAFAKLPICFDGMAAQVVVKLLLSFDEPIRLEI